ncbi:MAG: decaprenyl-phosphate phosphoribosyltransferase [Euryarchaeota archaeon]|nr:decaprenyl-phosphate phosphoribosyltransferase [Euryarchaeota archaeon]MBL01679.1 decaprenyl-phosphate phosphoribosyltransferase [Chloroflexota bacterium]|tara:strand:- start:5718 stop:6674 length:957 start_codon:yes stop_codon:yes gene_type:complete
MKKFKQIIVTSRPQQITKNFLVLIPLFFTINIWFSQQDISGVISIILKSLLALGIAILISSAVYYINDLTDINQDKNHPVKKNRPIANGDISGKLAITIAIILIITSLTLSYIISYQMLLATFTYLIINLFYSLYLKNLVIIDILCISASFVIRAIMGSIAIDYSIITINENQVELDLTISPWLYVVTGLGSLMLAIGKRRAEMKNLEQSNNYDQRIVLSKYSIPFIDSILNIVSSATLICYTLYTFNSESNSNVPDNNSMMITIPFVAFGIIRYIYLLFHDNKGETPEKILVSDLPTIINIILWIIAGSTILMVGKN